MRILKLSIVAVFAFIVFAACSQEQTSAPSGPETPAAPAEPAAPATPDEVATGENIYKQNCMKCHKEDGTGGDVEIRGHTLKAENLVSDKMKKEPDSVYIEYITKGVPSEGMPSFNEKLSQDEMKAVVKYIREKLQSQ